MAEAAITTIMPAYQAQDSIAAAVATTLSAMSDDDRLLVRDDGSTDRTSAVLADFRDPRMTVITGENVGVARGLQILLDAVETPLVARIDADDQSLPWRFGCTRHLIERGMVEVAFASSIGMSEGRGFTPKGPPFALDRQVLPVHLLTTNPLIHSTMLARTSVLREAGGYRMSAAEDYDLWLRLAVRDVPMLRLVTPVIRFNYGSGQVTAKPEWIDRLRNDPLLRGSYEDLCRKILGRDAPWFPSLVERWNGRPGDGAELRGFSEEMRAVARRLPIAARVFLTMRMRRLGLA